MGGNACRFPDALIATLLGRDTRGNIAMKFMRALVVLGLPIAALGGPALSQTQRTGIIRDVVCDAPLPGPSGSQERFAMTGVMQIEYKIYNYEPNDRRDALQLLHWHFQEFVKKSRPEVGPSLRVSCRSFEDRQQTAAEYVRRMQSKPGHERFDWDGRPPESTPAVVSQPEPAKPVPAAKPRSAPPAKSSSPPGAIVYGFADPDEESKTSTQRADEAAERERTRSLNAEQIRRAKEAKLAEEQRRASIVAERQAAHRAQIERQDAEYRAKLAAHNAEVARVRAEWEAQAARCRSGDKQACKGIASQQ